MGDPIESAYLFLICLVLALLEVQIEGPHGWAASLPTWKVAHPKLLSFLNGKPLTGYHVFMVSLLLLLIHFPSAWEGWTWGREANTLSMFFLMAVFWDFLWFIVNPHYGLRRFRRGEVWWIRRWVGRVPADYLLGLAVSFGVLFIVRLDAAHALRAWSITLTVLACGTALVAAIAPRRTATR